MKTHLILIVSLVLGITSVTVAQDTLKLSLRQAEKLFIAGNYQLIVQNYQIEEAKAEVITAKLFDNPEISYENLFYNHETKRFLETSYATGQYSATIGQLIKLAGKRNKNIQLAHEAVKLSGFVYFDLMRSLRYELRSTFYKAFYTKQSGRIYQQQIAAMEQLAKVAEKQLQLGNTSTKELIRIRSLLYGLKTEYTLLLNELGDLESQLRLLMNVKSNTSLVLSVSENEKQLYQLQDLHYNAILDSAKLNRPDLQLAKTTISYAEKKLTLQKAMAVPDVELSLSYDLKGNYPEKYTGIGITIPIPLFNRNQGEIKKARVAITAGAVALKYQENLLENEVYNCYNTALRTEATYQGIDAQFNGDFDQLIVELFKNFQSRNISLIEFLDLYEAYKENTLQLNNLRYERMNALEEINFVTGTSIFK